MKTDNLNGGHIQEILDGLIYSSLRPIVVNTDTFDIQAEYLLNVILRNKKRKITAIPRDEAVSLLVTFLSEEDRNRKFEILKLVRVERGFLFNFISRILFYLKDFFTVYNSYLKSNGLARKINYQRTLAYSRFLGCEKIAPIFVIAHTTADYFEQACFYRNDLISHYLRLAFKQAKIYCQNNPNSDFKDVYQDFLSAIARAIDKYDSTKGALTSYINWWILDAQTCSRSSHEYGIAYTLPPFEVRNIANQTSTSNNFSISLNLLAGNDEIDNEKLLREDSQILDSLIVKEEVTFIQKLVKLIDINSCARLVLDIDEYFFPEELDKMKKQMEKEQFPAKKPRKLPTVNTVRSKKHRKLHRI